MQQAPKNVVWINTPSTLDFTKVFGHLPMSFQHKVKFLIHEFNFFTIKDGSAKPNRNIYSSALGLSPNDFVKIIRLLIDEEIIEQVGYGNNINHQNNSYRFISPFNVKSAVTHTYDLTVSTRECPGFIKDWVTNDFKILKKPKKINKIATAKVSVKSQMQTEIERLKALLSANGIDYSTAQNVGSQELKPIKSDINKAIKVSNPQIVANNLNTDTTPVTSQKSRVDKVVETIILPLESSKEPENLSDMNKYNKAEDTYTIDNDGVVTTILQASTLIGYFKESKKDSKEFIKKRIAESQVNNNLQILDFFNQKTIYAKKELVNDTYYFSIQKIA